MAVTIGHRHPVHISTPWEVVIGVLLAVAVSVTAFFAIRAIVDDDAATTVAGVTELGFVIDPATAPDDLSTWILGGPVSAQAPVVSAAAAAVPEVAFDPATLPDDITTWILGGPVPAVARPDYSTWVLGSVPLATSDAADVDYSSWVLGPVALGG